MRYWLHTQKADCGALLSPPRHSYYHLYKVQKNAQMKLHIEFRFEGKRKAFGCTHMTWKSRKSRATWHCSNSCILQQQLFFELFLLIKLCRSDVQCAKATQSLCEFVILRPHVYIPNWGEAKLFSCVWTTNTEQPLILEPINQVLFKIVIYLWPLLHDLCASWVAATCHEDKPRDIQVIHFKMPPNKLKCN